MKRFKLISTIVMLTLVVSLLGFGVYSSLTNYSGITNKTEFVSGDENVFVRINATYDGPALTANGATATYFYELNKNDRLGYTNDQITISPWILGETNFTLNNKIISFTFEFDNLNDTNKLNVDLTDLAYDAEQKFSTSYSVASTVEELDTASLTTLGQSETADITNVPTQTIDVSGKLCIKLVYELKEFDQSFNFTNNINVTFSTALDAE